MKKPSKSDVLAFLGAVGAALVTTLIARVQNKNDISETVKAVLEEERRQLSDNKTEAEVDA